MQKAKEKYSKEKAAEYYKQNKETTKEKSREHYKNLSREEKVKSIKKRNINYWFHIKKIIYYYFFLI